MKRGPGRPRNVKTGNRGRPCKKYQMVPADSNVEVEPDYRRRGSVGTMSETEHEERTWKDTKRENWKSGKAT